MRCFRKSRPQLIRPRFQCQLCHVTPDRAIPLAVCIFMLSMLVVVAEHMQLATRDRMNHVEQCCIYSHHTTFKHAPLMLPSLNKILPAMVLQNEVVKSNVWCLSCSSSHASVRHVSYSPALSFSSDLGKVVVGAVVLLLLLMSGDVEMNPGPVGNKLTSDDLGCVLREVLDMSARWYNLGLQLKVRVGTLNSIRADFSAPKHQLREMLKAWLTTGDAPSWRTLIAALRSRMVGESHLAAALEAKYCPIEITALDIGTSSPPYPFPMIDTPPPSEPQVAAMIRHPPPPHLHTQGTKYSPELKVLDLYCNELVESISHPERVAFELYSQDLISLKVRDETMIITAQSTYVRVSKLVAAVKDQIVANPSVFHKFLSVLRGDPSLVYIADAMSDHYWSLLPPRVADTSTPTLSQLAAELRDFKNWYLLGLHFNISTDILDSIEKTHDTSVRCCIAMFQHWINNSKNSSWDAIHEALRNIGESVIAEEIAAKYNIQPSTTSLEHPSGRGEETSESSSKTYALKMRQTIPQKQRRIASYFAIVLDRITEIVASSVELDKLLQFLQFYGHPLNPEMHYIDQQILQSTSVFEVMKCLFPNYINCMETGLLEAIIERFECKEAQTLLQQYHDHYPINRLLRDMPDPVSDETLDLTRRRRLRVECDGDFDSARALGIKRVRTATESATGIDHQFVTHAQHSDGGGNYPISESHRDMADPGETSAVKLGVAGRKRKQLEGIDQSLQKKIHLGKGQQSIKEKEEASLIDIKPKMEWSVKEELKDVKIEPSEKDIKLGQVETFSGLRKGDLVEQLAIKSQIVHDMINQLGKQVAEEERQMAKKDEQIAEKDELIVKYQQMYEGLQKKLKSPGKSPPVSIKAYMRGTEVIAQQTFTLTQEAVDLKFEGYGFKLHVPEGSLPEEVSETWLNVRVSLSGLFQLPTNCELISAVYWVSSPHKFMKAITVEIQHCAALSSDEQSEQLTFIHTKCTQKELPYVFKEQVGGIFSRHSSDGSVSLSHFSGLGIVRRLLRVFGLQTNDSELGQQPPPSQQQSSTHTKRAAGQEEEDTVVQYCAQLYTRKYVKEWRVDFVVTKNLESCTSVVEKEYSSHGRQQFSFIFGFKKDFISLKIPVKGLQLDGWKITPFYKPKITRKEVNSFKSTSGTRIPKCELVVEWVQDTPPVRLQHSISLIGAHDHHNFMLHINPDADISTPIPVEVGGTSSSNSATTTSHNNSDIQQTTSSSLVSARVPSLQSASGIEELDEEDHTEITYYLTTLDKTHIYRLALVLGLSEHRAKSMKDSETFLNDVVEAWIQKTDQVIKRGVPTWQRLVEALKDKTVGQNGIASTIATDKLLQ